jgi:hypothetical protein
MNYRTKALTELIFLIQTFREYKVRFLNINFVAHFSAPSSPLPGVVEPPPPSRTSAKALHVGTMVI